MSKLNDNPGLFENHQKKLCELFGELTENHFVLSNVIEMIFEHVSRVVKPVSKKRIKFFFIVFSL